MGGESVWLEWTQGVTCGAARPAPADTLEPLNCSPHWRCVENSVSGRQSDAMTTVLFACVHNAERSQMAAAWFNALADPAKARAISAGTHPGPRVHPEVIAVMGAAGC